MSNYFDDLIREGRDTDAVRLFAREYYENGKMGHTRLRLLIRVADENDRLHKVVEAAKETLLMCDNAGDFRNGNSYYGIDEGQTAADKILGKLRQALAELKGGPADE